MGTYRALLFCLLLLGSACAQQAQKDQFKVEGVIVNSLSGKPLPRVLVQLNGHALLTGPEGEFSFDSIPPGRAYISLTKPGYFGPGALPGSRSSGTMVDVGPDTGRVVLKMVPEAVIFGRVTGQDEDPLEGAGIQVLTRAYVDGRQTFTQPRGEVRTDEDGNFRIASLPPGRYYLMVKAGAITRRVLGAQTSKAPEVYPAAVYYPGTADVAAASLIDLAPGQKLEAQFSLALAPAYKLAGNVVASGEWKRVHPPTIIDSLEQALFTVNRFDAATGSFEFRAIPAGTHTVRMSGTDLQDHYRFSDQKITVSRSTNDVRLLLRPGTDIPVVTRTEFNKPPSRGSCVWGGPGGQTQHSDCSDYPAAIVDLVSTDSMRARVSSEYQPMEDPSRFALHGVAPGKYMIRVRCTVGGGYVESVHSGNLDLVREVLTVPENGSVAPIEVVLRDDSGTLKITVRAEKPGQPASIVIFMDGALFPTQQLAGATSSDMLFSIPPGNYKVLAFDNLNGLEYGNPAVLAQYASKAGSATVPANGNASVVVDLIHVGE